MTLEALALWLLFILGCELLQATLVAYALGVLLCATLAVLWLAVLGDQDLLASMLLAVYSSVFVLLSLLALRFGPYWAPATSGTEAPRTRLALLALPPLALLLPAGLWAGAGTPWWAGLAWHDLYLAERDPTHLASAYLHWLFFRVCAWETIWLNLYLFAGLAAAIGLLLVLRAWADPAQFGALLARLRLEGAHAAARNARLRLVNKFRRQVRRRNSSRVAHRP